jgi:mono/diheme cytochrome c family protein
LERSLNRYLAAGIACMVMLVVGFIAYGLREPSLRADATVEQRVDYTRIGRRLFATTCADCHGGNAEGGGGAPTLNSKQFLSSTSDAQIHMLIAGGVSGSDMAAWGLAFGGTLTDEQVQQIVTYLRSLESDAPSITEWRDGASAP